MKLSSSKTINKTYEVHRNVGDAIIKLYNYHLHQSRVYNIIFGELKRTGMDCHSVMVIDRPHENKLVHTICHSPTTAYKLTQQLPRQLIVHMTTGEYLEISTDSNGNIFYTSLNIKLQPHSVRVTSDRTMVRFVVPRPKLSNR